MRPLAILTEFFVNAFQITRPRPDQQKRAEWILGGLTLAALLAMAAITVGMLIWAFHG